MGWSTNGLVRRFYDRIGKVVYVTILNSISVGISYMVVVVVCRPIFMEKDML